MARPKKSDVDNKIAILEKKAAAEKKAYESTVAELKELYKLQKKERAEKLFDAMNKKGKTFEEVMRLINL